MNIRAKLRVCVILSAAGLVLGCSIAPRRFAQIDDPTPLVRARAIDLGRELPDSVAIPALISRLDDPDGVVRLKAHEELKTRTDQDFGFVPWGDAPDRAVAATRWGSWWEGRTAGLSQFGAKP